jgi:hypothetical protein
MFTNLLWVVLGPIVIGSVQLIANAFHLGV